MVRLPADTPTVYSPAMLYAKVATKTLSTTWFGRSRRKLRSIRGENCVDESCSATTVRPRVSAMTVIIVPAVPISSVRASSGVPWKANRCIHVPGRVFTLDRIEPKANASTTAIAGNTHSAPRRYSQAASRLRTPEAYARSCFRPVADP